MIFVKHSKLEGLHAPFSASQSSWLRYDDDKAMEVYLNKKASVMGTRLHAWAKDTIDLRIKQPRSKKTLYAYVNDAIGFKMDTEVVLFYSERFFGTADAISFRDNFLRIHDLKTGKSGKIEDHVEQLEIYAALFCFGIHLKLCHRHTLTKQTDLQQMAHVILQGLNALRSSSNTSCLFSGNINLENDISFILLT